MGEPADDEAALLAYGAALADAVEAALPGWVVRSIVARATAAGFDVDSDAIDTAARDATAAIGPRLRVLLALDADEQRANPLAVVRDAVEFPTRVLHSAGVPPAARDDFAANAFPADIYDLAPATWSDVDPVLVDPGITWGAAKAHVILTRRAVERREH